MLINDYLPSDFEPHHLNREEREDPYTVIQEFFSYVHLPEARESLWEWLQLTVSGEFNILSCTARSNIIFFYEITEKLVEAVHIIHQRRKGGVT